jgi:hypothetical protein
VHAVAQFKPFGYMKKYFFILVLFLLLNSIIAGEIPNDFLKSDNPHWKAYFKKLLVFPETSLSLESFVQCLKIPHVSTRFDAPVTGFMTKMISLSSTNLLPRQALWELKQQTGYNITAVEDNTGTLLINYPKRDVLK